MNIYDYQRPLGKIDDIPELREKFIAIYDTGDHKQMVRFCMALGRHILDMTGYTPYPEITASFEAMQKWLDGKVNYHEARNLCFEIHRYATAEKDPIKARFLRTMAQITASPHVKYHALWATDFAVTLVNRMHPGNLDEARKEREMQIALAQGICLTHQEGDDNG